MLLTISDYASSGARLLHQSDRALSLQQQRPHQHFFKCEFATCAIACRMQSPAVVETLWPLHRRAAVLPHGASLHDAGDICACCCRVHFFETRIPVFDWPKKAQFFNYSRFCCSLCSPARRRCRISFTAAFSSASRAAFVAVSCRPNVQCHRWGTAQKNARQSCTCPKSITTVLNDIAYALNVNNPCRSPAF